jgi:membrane associated rhomboid family serine protease
MNLLKQNTRKKILLGQGSNVLMYLIIFNVILYIIITFVSIIYLTNNSTEDVFRAQVLSWFSVPAQPAVFGTRPWALVTYMFSHFGLWDIISNMLWLWGFGYLLQDLIGGKKLVPLYLYGGFAGSVVFMLTVNLVPAISKNVNSVYPLIGSGPAIMAIAIAATALAPRYRAFPMINIPLWAITALFVVVRLATTGYENPGHIVAMLAGGAMGYVFVWQLGIGNDIGQWMVNVVDWVDGLFNPEKKLTSSRNQLFYKTTKKPYEKTPHVTKERVDELLDKINQKGYHSLTEEEKAFLQKASAEEL